MSRYALHYHDSLHLIYASCLLLIYLEIFFILFLTDLRDPLYATAKRRKIVQHPWIASIWYFQGVHSSGSNTQLSWFTTCFFLLLTYRRHHLTTWTVFITDVIYCLVLSSTLLYHILNFWQNFQLLFWVIIYPKQLPNLGRKIMPSASYTIVIRNLKGTEENLKDGIFKYHLHSLRKPLLSKQG